MSLESGHYSKGKHRVTFVSFRGSDSPVFGGTVERHQGYRGKRWFIPRLRAVWGLRRGLS